MEDFASASLETSCSFSCCSSFCTQRVNNVKHRGSVRLLPAADATLPRSQRPPDSCGELLPAQHPACSPDACGHNAIFNAGRVAYMCRLCRQFLLLPHLLLRTSQHRAAIPRTSKRSPDSLLLRRAPSLHSAAAAAGAAPQQQRPQSAHAAGSASRIRIYRCVTARAAGAT